VETSAEITTGRREIELREQTDKGTWKPGDGRAHSVNFSCFIASSLLLALSFFILPLQASGNSSQGKSGSEIPSKIGAKVKFSFGYDNNVSERKEDQVESRFFQFYVNSSMCISPYERTLLSLKLQDGLKYLDAPSLSDESVLINSLNLRLSHRISERLVPELQSEIRGRTSIHSDSGVSPSEEAYLRGSAGMALRTAILSDVIGRAFWHYRFTNFEDFDPFDRRGPLMGLRADVRLLPGATVSVQYSREKTSYSKWELISPEDNTSRTDTMDDISFFTQFYKYLLFDITYSHQNNESDVDGYSYRANRASLLMARSFPYGIMFQLYALIRSKKYQSPSDESDPAQLDLEDDERGVLTVKVSKDISRGTALEAQYDLRRARTQEEKGLYTKSMFSLSLSFNL
jgi:hypothetical protein